MSEIKEEIILLTVEQAAGQALWDLQQWTKDHLPTCNCFTCLDTIPDLCRALGQSAPERREPTLDERFDPRSPY